MTAPAQAPRTAPVEVRTSPIHGAGVFARRHLPAGTVIGRYEGRRYSADAARDRAWDHGLTYVFGLSDGSLIDGSEGGNHTRHINHSCEPNCVAWEVEDAQGRLHVEVETLRPVRRGEELFLDYSLSAEQADPDSFGCRCGAPACRGTMLAPEELPAVAG